MKTEDEIKHVNEEILDAFDLVTSGKVDNAVFIGEEIT